MRPYRIRWNAILLVFIGGALAMAVRAQAPPPPPAPTWPPAPADIVNLRADSFALPASGGARIFDVPGDRWFVLTDITGAGTATAGGAPDTSFPMILSEANGATITPKLEVGTQSPYHSSGAVGFTFKPGSRVLADLDLAGVGGSITNKEVYFSIQGYLVTQP